MQLKTSYATPWALILSGGVVPGQRPRCTLAWIVEALAVDGKIVAFKVVPHEGDDRPTKRARRIDAAGVLRTWRNRPQAAALRRARAALKRSPMDQ